MYGVILAAGSSERLKPLTKKIPKTLLRINNVSLLERIINNTYEYLKTYIFVVGHGADAVNLEIEDMKQKYDFKSILVFNPKYSTANNCYSLYLAIRFLLDNNMLDDIVVINSDDIFDKRIFLRLIKESRKTMYSILIIDMEKQLGEEEMKVKVQEGKIVKISKNIPLQEASGEFIGISLIKKEYLSPLKSSLENIMAVNPNLYYEDAFQQMIDLGYTFEYITTGGLFWNEIDTLDDLKETERKIKIIEGNIA